MEDSNLLYQGTFVVVAYTPAGNSIQGVITPALRSFMRLPPGLRHGNMYRVLPFGAAASFGIRGVDVKPPPGNIFIAPLYSRSSSWQRRGVLP